MTFESELVPKCHNFQFQFLNTLPAYLIPKPQFLTSTPMILPPFHLPFSIEYTLLHSSSFTYSLSFLPAYQPPSFSLSSLLPGLDFIISHWNYSPAGVLNSYPPLSFYSSPAESPNLV